MRRGLIATVAALAFAAPAHAGGPHLLFGGVADVAKSQSLPETKAKLDLLRLAGLQAVRVTVFWQPGAVTPAADDVRAVKNVASAARLDGLALFVTVVNQFGRTAPTTDADRADFAAFTTELVRKVPTIDYLIVGNEPNLSRFWIPQFNDDGTDAAAPAYEALLAQTYDAVKAAFPKERVLGGAVSPHGSDNPKSSSVTHSPTAFITDMGAAYAASGRTTKIMDGFVIHPYEDNSSIDPVASVHPRTTTIAIADYDKLVALLDTAFPGQALPIYYGEFGVETMIPPAKARLYTGTEPASVHAVDEQTQARYYQEAVQLAFCQPRVRALLIYLPIDEPDLNRWQSGVYYVDGTPKSTLPALRAAINEARRGIVAQCPGLQLTPRATAAVTRRALSLTCDIDCNYLVRFGKRQVRGVAIGAKRKVIRLPGLRGGQRVRVQLTAPVNPGPAKNLTLVAPRT